MAALLRGPDDVRLLWEVAQVPDFQSVLTDAHTRLLREVFPHLAGPTGRLPEDWVEPQVRRLDRTEGDIDVLLARIAAIRTWTYIAHRSAGWPTPATGRSARGASRTASRTPSTSG